MIFSLFENKYIWNPLHNAYWLLHAYIIALEDWPGLFCEFEFWTKQLLQQRHDPGLYTITWLFPA